MHVPNIRKVITKVELTRMAGGVALDFPTRKAAVSAVISNPFAGCFAEELEQLYSIGERLGSELGSLAVAALGIGAQDVQSYGKGVLVGTSGELEHAAAILHPKFGRGLRSVTGGGKALIPSSKKVGGPGQTLDIPLGHKDAAYVQSHFDAIEVSVSDAPRSGELVVTVAVTDSGRPGARIGGLSVNDVIGEDGLS